MILDRGERHIMESSSSGVLMAISAKLLRQLTHRYALLVQCVDFLVAPVEFLPLKRIEASRGVVRAWQLLPSQHDLNTITRDIECAPKGVPYVNVSYL